MANTWRVRLGAAAEIDFANIVGWTAETFGPRQARTHSDTLISALEELVAGPGIAGSISRDEIVRGLLSLHVGRHGRRGRHFLLYRPTEGQVIEIVRILHDSMDLQRHIPSE